MHVVQVVFAFVTRVFDFLTDVVSSGAGLVAPLRRVDCSNLPKDNSSAPGTSPKIDDLNVLYQQVHLLYLLISSGFLHAFQKHEESKNGDISKGLSG
jgi:hypothetical protein